MPDAGRRQVVTVTSALALVGARLALLIDLHRADGFAVLVRGGGDDGDRGRCRVPIAAPAFFERCDLLTGGTRSSRGRGLNGVGRIRSG